MAALKLLSLLAGAAVITSLSYYAAATLAASSFARRSGKPLPRPPKIRPKVAILKPLRGRSERLLANLTTYLELDYPRAEYLFAVPSYSDPAAEAPCALRARYKFRPMTLIVGGAPGCSNRKVAKLIRMAERARDDDILVLSDADISVDRDHLNRLVAELCAEERIGAVTCLYRANHAGTFSSRLEALFVNTDFAPQVMLSAAVEPMRYALGATIALKRKALDAIGGFERLKDLLADDYYLGKLISDAGFEVRLSTSIVTTASEEKAFSGFWARQLRWARTFRTTRPASLATILINGPFWATIFLFASGGSTIGFAALATVLAARIGMSWYVVRYVLQLPDEALESWLAPFKDLVMAAIWFASLTGNEVEWGGRRLRIMAGGVMREVDARS